MAQTEFLTLQSDFDVRGKKEEIWLGLLTKATLSTEKSKKQNQESTKGYSKSIVWKNTTISEKGFASTSRKYASPKGSGPGVWRSKRPLSACHTCHKRFEYMQVPKGTGLGVRRSKHPLLACRQSNVKNTKTLQKKLRLPNNCGPTWDGQFG